MGTIFFIVAVLIVLGGIGAIIMANAGGRLGGVAAVLVGLVITGFVTFSIIPPKQVGIPVTFGAVGAPMRSGPVFHAPWTDIHLMDAAWQALDAVGDKATIAKDKDRADVFVHNNVRWSVAEDKAATLYLEAKGFENVDDLIVQPALRESIAAVMQSFDPLAESNPSNAELAAKVKELMVKSIGDRVDIESVTITLLDFSEATKSRINALNTEKGNTRIANQKKVTAAAEAEANKVLADSIKNDPNILVSKCLDQINEGKALPAGFQCWPGTGGSVVLPAGK